MAQWSLLSEEKVTTRRQTWHFSSTLKKMCCSRVVTKSVFYRTTGKTAVPRHEFKNGNWNSKRWSLAMLSTLIMAGTASDPICQEQSYRPWKSKLLFKIMAPAIALFDCVAALDGSSTNTQSFAHAAFIITKLVKQKWRTAGGGWGNCLLEVISHNHAVAVAIGGISLPSLLITVCLWAPKGLENLNISTGLKLQRWRYGENVMEHFLFKQQNRGAWNGLWQKWETHISTTAKSGLTLFCELLIDCSSCFSLPASQFCLK